MITNNLKENNINLIPKNQYRAVIRKYLDEKDLQPSTHHVVGYFIALGIVVGGISLILSTNLLIVKLLVSIIMGLSLASLTFFLHDLMHGSILASKNLQQFVGLTVGIFNFFSPLFWQRVHNFHHARTGALDDPDRSYVIDEISSTWLEKVAYKTRMSNESFNRIITYIFMSLGFVFYFSNTLAGAFFKADNKYARLKSLFSLKEKMLVLLQYIIIFGFQYFLFKVIASGSLATYMFISIIPVLIAHFIAMLYIHTNHFLSPLTGEIDDPLINSLSINDNKFVDAIFLNFSHHVEHHLFPAMNSSYYPKVRQIIQQNFPGRLQILTMKEAVDQLFGTPRTYQDFTSLIGTNGSNGKCLVPQSK